MLFLSVFPDIQKLVISGEKLQMSAEFKGYVM